MTPRDLSTQTIMVRLQQMHRETFDVAASVGAISPELAGQLKPSVGMRNVLIHEYVNVDLELVALAAPHARQQYGQYVSSVAAWLKDSGQSSK